MRRESKDGGIGRNASLPHTIKRRTTNLKTTRTAKKIKLYGSPTTKELKKKHSSRMVHRAVSGRCGKVRQRLPDSIFHICMRISQEEQLGSETDHATRVPV